MPSAPTKKKRIQWIIILIVVLSFIVGIQIYTGDRDQPLSYQKEKMSETKPQQEKEAEEDPSYLPDGLKAKSYDEVLNYYEKRAPGLKRAKNNDMTTSPKQSVSLPDHNGKLYINEIWDSGNKIYFLYSVDLSVLDGSSSQTLPKVENIHIQPLTGNSKFDKKNPSTYMMYPGNSGMVFNHKLYGIAVLGHIPKNKDTGPQAIDETVLASFNMELPKGFYKTDSVSVKLHYHPDEMHITTIPLKGTYQKNGVTIQPKELDVRMDRISLKLMIDTDKDLTPNIIGTLVTKEGEERTLQNLKKIKGQKNLYQVNLQPLSRKLTDASIQIDGINYNKDKSYSFDLDISDYQKQDSKTDHPNYKQLHKKVKKVDRTEIYLAGKNYSQNGLSLDFQFESLEESPETYMAAGTMDDFEDANHLKRKVHITTDAGETNSVPYGGRKNHMSIYLNKTILEAASEVTITFDETTYYQVINHSFSVNASDDRS
ncbi:hypothetical protein Q7A53_13440 [Halobacillus rhizosphaerae]|uniref:hypothetical protein n=1 Tax=Halobacillus rhizosphaerae TaxID=3064889 RepID=UPI00398B0360